MCFETTKSAKAKIAKTDIECWKVVNRDLTNVFSRHLKDRFDANPVRYESEKAMPKIVIKKEVSDFWYGDMQINKGYHSFIKKPLLKILREWKVDNKKIIIHKFIIPTGTRYFENKTEYVSESIMML
jgi:hypothetical protein